MGDGSLRTGVALLRSAAQTIERVIMTPRAGVCAGDELMLALGAGRDVHVQGMTPQLDQDCSSALKCRWRSR